MMEKNRKKALRRVHRGPSSFITTVVLSSLGPAMSSVAPPKDSLWESLVERDSFSRWRLLPRLSLAMLTYSPFARPDDTSSRTLGHPLLVLAAIGKASLVSAAVLLLACWNIDKTRTRAASVIPPGVVKEALAACMVAIADFSAATSAIRTALGSDTNRPGACGAV